MIPCHNAHEFTGMFVCLSVVWCMLEEGKREGEEEVSERFNAQEFKMQSGPYLLPVVSAVHCNVYYFICGTGLTLHS